MRSQLFLLLLLISSVMSMLGQVSTTSVSSQTLPSITFSPSGSVATIQMTGSAIRTYGSDQETGTVTLQASADGQSQIQLSFGAGTWSETQGAATSVEGQCASTGSDGVTHITAPLNCWRGTVWFLPQIALQTGAGWSDNVGSYVAAQSGGGTFHYERHPRGTMSDSTASLLARLSAYDLQIDSSGLPVALMFATHPDDDSSVDIPIEIHFSDYHTVAGVLVPFHIQKLINHGVVLDLQITNVQINPL